MRPINVQTVFWILTVLVSGAFAQEQAFPWREEGSRTLLLDQSAKYQPTRFAEQTIVLSPGDIDRLLAARPGDALSLPSLDLGFAKGAPLTFRASSLYQEHSRIHVVDQRGSRLLAPSKRRFVIGSSATGSAGLAIDPWTYAVSGLFMDGNESYEVSSQKRADGAVELLLVNMREAIANTPFQCGTDPSHSARTIASQGVFPSQSLSPKGAGVTYQTTIAVDTDRAFTGQPRFGGQAANVRDYIEDLFAFMNAIYERDMGLHLVLGDVFINFSQDPYVGSAGLNEFGDFWRQNRTTVDRDFAMVLGGISGGFSGVAWVGAYCNTGQVFGNSVFGSYSYNGIGNAFSASQAAQFVGHEIGHNLGSSHTHCEQLANGGTAFVDQCYSCEDYDRANNCQSSCYIGPTTCQTGSTGSVMSYCHAGPSGFDGSGPSQGTSQNCTLTGEFHPLIIDKIGGLLAANNPSCIDDFGGGFDLSVGTPDLSVCKPDDAATAVTVMPQGAGFTDFVTLTASNLPPGASAAFAPNPVAPGGSSTLTVGVGAVADGNYTIGVDGSGGSAQASTAFNLAVLSASAMAPTLVTPADGATVQAGSALTFSDSAAATYTVEIAADAAFADIVESAVVTDTSYVPTLLQTETTYFWRVTANAACGVGAVSASRSFTTDSEICASPNVAVGPGQLFESTLPMMVDGAIDDIDISVEIETTFPDAFDIEFIHTPTGETLFLIDNIFDAGCFGSSPDSIDTRFDDEAAVSVLDACLNDQLNDRINVRPSDPLSDLDGVPLSADWTLRVTNYATATTGTFVRWCVHPTFAATPTTAMLSVAVSGPGQVLSSPTGISCPNSSCQSEFQNETLVTLTPVAQPNARFDRWIGNCTGSGSCNIAMTESRSVTAQFVSNDVSFRSGFEGLDPIAR